jgi:hypothetical protein
LGCTSSFSRRTRNNELLSHPFRAARVRVSVKCGAVMWGGQSWPQPPFQAAFRAARVSKRSCRCLRQLLLALRRNLLRTHHRELLFRAACVSQTMSLGSPAYAPCQPLAVVMPQIGVCLNERLIRLLPDCGKKCAALSRTSRFNRPAHAKSCSNLRARSRIALPLEGSCQPGA